MGGSGVTAQRNGIRQTSGKESRGNRAQWQEHEKVPRKQSPGLGPTFGPATDAGTECFSPKDCSAVDFAKPKLGQRDEGWGR